MKKEHSKPRRYKSATAQNIYNAYKEQFDKEGDCYEKLITEIDKGETEDGDKIPVQELMFYKGILNDVYVDYCVDNHVVVYTEEEYINRKSN